jgi:hypothetical protein
MSLDGSRSLAVDSRILLQWNILYQTPLPRHLSMKDCKSSVPNGPLDFSSVFFRSGYSLSLSLCDVKFHPSILFCSRLFQIVPQAGTMFMVWEACRRLFVYNNGYTTSPFQDEPRPGLDQSRSPEELKQWRRKQKDMMYSR